MSSEGAKSNNVAGVCFLMMWLGVWLFISLLIGPLAILFVVFGILVFVKGLKQKEVRRGMQSAELKREPELEVKPTIVNVDRRIIYQVPRKCPECGGSLSNAEVDWVGPLQAKCPFCRTTVEAQPT